MKRSEDRAPGLAVLVDDAAAIYPVRIDPTFSDADWTEASRNSSFTGPELEAAVARDFGAWVKQERLPKPPQPKQ